MTINNSESTSINEASIQECAKKSAAQKEVPFVKVDTVYVYQGEKFLDIQFTNGESGRFGERSEYFESISACRYDLVASSVLFIKAKNNIVYKKDKSLNTESEIESRYVDNYIKVFKYSISSGSLVFRHSYEITK
jgi:hypothetical protein